MNTVLKLLDDAFSSICVGKPRWVVEVLLVLVASIVIHFSYSVLSTRHERIVKEAHDRAPTQHTGDAVTNGDQSPAVTGNGNDFNYNGSAAPKQHKSEPPRKDKQ